ncbi:MAG: glycoside hydrolase family 92 protein [Propionibacteriales bacterium]|nr:glycoside hydrolase family 92 protein [Propionibacteriales bacterium]
MPTVTPCPRPRRHAGRGLLVPVASVALSVCLIAASPSTASATPTAPPSSAPEARTMAAGDFASSFEDGEPAPTWADTVDTDADGSPRSAGVTGPDHFGLPGDISAHITEVTASAENTGAGEVAVNVADGDINSKWLAFESSAWLHIELDEPVTIVRYALTSANDAPERDPRAWELQGSADGVTWTTIDTRTAQQWDERFQTREFELAAAQTYQHYRLDISANQSGGLLQLAEWQMSDGSEPPPPLEHMISRPEDGPSSAYAAKRNVGFTGLHSFEYAGKVTGEGRGWSSNRVFDVDIPVGPQTELSYRIFPQFIKDDLTYRSTYAAVDLAFTDGTYLSELAAKDQHGFTLSPRGQGDSKSLYTDQWNHKQSVIGAVADGKTIDRILVTYDAPSGPGGFRGWIDDVTIAGDPETPEVDSFTDYVRTTRGTQSSGSFSRGNNIPATAVPHGFNFWAPVTNAGSLSWFYRYHEDNNDQNLPELQALQLTHETSPWMGDRQTFQLMPSAASGIPDPSRAARALPFRHENETARPHYYGVTFENDITAEITPTDHAAMFRFTFPGDDANLVFDNVNNNGGLTLDVADGSLTGYTDTRSGLSNGATRMYVYATFDQPVTAGDKLANGNRGDVTGYLKFDTSAERQVTMRVATSLLSVAQAEQNLAQEIAADDSFDDVRDRAHQAWEDKLSILEVEGATRDQLTSTYSSLYRLFLYPNSGYENTGTVDEPVYEHAVQSTTASTIPPGTTPTETGAEIADGKVYVNNGFWDTYRTTWAAYSLFTPGQAAEMVNGFVQQYEDSGWVSRWSSPGYANLMTGTSSDVSFADAYVKGVKGIDAKLAYEAAVKNAAVAPPVPNPDNPSVGRKGLQSSQFLGFTPSRVSEGISWALEGYINDYGIANMASALADDPDTSEAEARRYREEHTYYLNRARNYTHMFDPSVSFFQGRSADGTWKSTPEEYDPRVWGHDHDYTETNGWNFAFHAPQDGQGLANLYGGRDGLSDKLDAFFSMPETGKFPGSYGGIIHEITEARDVRMGMWGFSNQVSHHIPWMYLYSGQPWKTQEKVREVLSRMYVGSEIGQGYAGDEDNGETSAWYLFASLGLYPLQMGSADLVIGSPQFTKATLHLEHGEDLVINAPDNSRDNVYVQGVKVNGEAWSKTSVPHALLAEGGTVDFDMGSEPSSWGTAPKDAPTSITSGSKAPAPLEDRTRAASVHTSAGDGAALRDDTSGTDWSFDGEAGWVEYRFTRPQRLERFYTLTSGSAGPAPSGWVLKASNDGTTWTTLDSRSDEVFEWGAYTRPFAVENRARFKQFRLELVGTPGATSSLSEIELFGAD